MIKYSFEDKLKRLKTNYPFLFPLNCTKEELISVGDKINNLEDTKKVLVISSSDLIKPSFLSLVLKEKKYSYITFLNCYRLVDIYLQLDIDYLSLNDINSPIVGLYYGLEEIENARQLDLFKHFIELSLMSNKKLWVFLKGNKPPINQMKEYLLSKDFNLIVLDNNNSTKSNKVTTSYDTEF